MIMLSLFFKTCVQMMALLSDPETFKREVSFLVRLYREKGY